MISRIYIADISCDEKTIERLVNVCNSRKINLRLFDHHASAKWIANAYPDIAVVECDGECGASLLFKYYDSVADIRSDISIYEKIRKFICDVRDRDLFTFKKNGNLTSYTLQQMMIYIGSAEKLSYILLDRIRSNDPIVYDEDYDKAKETLDIMNNYINNNINNYIKCEYNGWSFAITFNNKYTSDIGNAICDAHNDIDVYMCINTELKKVELRATKPEINLVGFAVRMGGGGHPHAAGFPLTDKMIAGIAAGVLTNGGKDND